MAKPFFFSGSSSDHFEQQINILNPLPPCPDSPNCVRISRTSQQPAEIIFEAAKSAVNKMNPVKVTLSENPLRIDVVFKVFIYKDDFSLLVENNNNGKLSTRIYIRSASRAGYSDLGVNRRRVKRFLKLLKNQFFIDVEY